MMQPLLPEGSSYPSLHRSDRDPILVDSECLIHQAFEQDAREGYTLLFRRYYRTLCSQAVRVVYARETAEDIVSDVFFNFWKNKTYLTITTSYRAYLFMAVRNRVLNHLHNEFRRDAALGKPTGTFNDPLLEEDPQQLLQYTELYNRIDYEVRSLPPQCQRVFLLSRFEGKKHREIADELQIAQKTVEAHLARALTHLRKVLQMGLLGLLGLVWF